MDALFLVIMPLFTAVGSALLAFFYMQARLDVAVSKEREALIEAKSALSSKTKEMEAKIQAAEEETRRKSLDDFIRDFRVEERHYMRESKSLFLKKKSMVMQERLFFRNIPLSNWVEHELTVEEGSEAPLPSQNGASIFTTSALHAKEEEQLAPAATAVGRFLR